MQVTILIHGEQILERRRFGFQYRVFDGLELGNNVFVGGFFVRESAEYVECLFFLTPEYQPSTILSVCL